MEERFLRFAGAINLRDVGGYFTESGQKVKTGQLYRSGSLARLEDDGLSSLGIREVWDLRSADEVAEHPDKLPNGVKYVNRPMRDPGPRFRRRAFFALLFRQQDKLKEMMLEGYTDIIVQQNAHVVGEFFEQLTRQRPLLIHCTAGKDRTGVFIALLLALLGVPREIILDDYELSNAYYDSYVKGLRKELTRLRVLRINETHLRPLLWVEREQMGKMLDFVEKEFGSVERYLVEKAGVSAETLVKLRTDLLTQS